MFALKKLYDEPDEFDEADPDEDLEVKITSNGYLQFQWSNAEESLMALSIGHAKIVVARMQELIDEIEGWSCKDRDF